VFRFCVGGGLGVLTAYATLYILTEFAHVWYVASAVIAAILNYVVNFTMQKLWTFENKEVKAIPKQALLYFTMGAIFMPANAGLLYVLVEYVHLPYMLAQVILTVLFSIASYFITHKIFTPKTPSSSTG
jgi:putative flippase GtrA